MPSGSFQPRGHGVIPHTFPVYQTQGHQRKRRRSWTIFSVNTKMRWLRPQQTTPSIVFMLILSWKRCEQGRQARVISVWHRISIVMSQITENLTVCSTACGLIPHNNDITWASRRLKSSTPLPFVHQIVQDNIKENTKAPHYWPFVGRIHQWNPLTKGQLCEKCFLVMTCYHEIDAVKHIFWATRFAHSSISEHICFATKALKICSKAVKF